MATNVSHCPNCGLPLPPETTNFCPSCGARIITVSSPGPQSLSPGYYPPVTTAPQPISTGPYKAIIGIMLVIIVLLGVAFYASSHGSLFSLGNAYRYQLANPPNALSIEPRIATAIPPPSAVTTWNACGSSPSQGCNVTAGGWREGSVPDTFDYYVSFNSNVPITVYFFTLGQFVQFAVCNGNLRCVSPYYDSLAASTRWQNQVFKLAEGCADYVAIFVASASGIMYPNISVNQNAAPNPTGYCAQGG